MQFEKIKPPIWNLWRDGVTQSLITKWLQCPLQCELEYVHGWTPLKQSEPILFGKICHYVLEQAYQENQAPLGGMVELYLRQFKETNEKEDESLSDSEFEKREELYCKAAGLLKAYFFYFKDDFNLRWRALEQVFRINGPSGTGIELNGMLDGAFSKTEDSKDIYLMDHKFLSMINIEQKEMLLPADFQVNFYVYAIRKFLRKIDPDLKIKGFYYNIVRRPALKKTKKEATLRMFEDKIFEDIMCRPSHYFFSERHKKTRDPLYVPVCDEEIDQFERRQLRPILQNIERWFESDFKWPGYYNPVSLETKYGPAAMSKAIIYKDFSELYQRTTPFAELAG